MAALAKMAAVGIGSALIAYLFDPERGKGRRARALDQAKSRMKRLQEAAERKMEYQSNRLQGLKHDLLPDDSPDHDLGALGDDELREKIKSELIGPSQVSVDVEVQGGKVTLVGELEEGQYRDLEKRILKMSGIDSVDLKQRAPSASGESA